MAEADEEKLAFEQQLQRALDARTQYFEEQADSLTLESVRRLLERDLGLEKLALDAHKRFIRRCLEQKMDGADAGNSNPTTENVDKGVQPNKEEKKPSPKQEEGMSDPEKVSTGTEDTMEESPVMGVLSPKPEVGSQGSSLSESTIEKAIWERADHIQANSEKISMAEVRQLLAEDLGIAKKSLDAFRKFISQQVHDVLQRPKSVKDVKKKGRETVKSKTKNKVYNEEGSDTSQSESDEMRDADTSQSGSDEMGDADTSQSGSAGMGDADTSQSGSDGMVDADTSQSGSDGMADEVKSRKEAAPRRNNKKLEQSKKRKISKSADIDVSHKKQKNGKRQKEDNNSNGDGSLSEDGVSQSPIERPSLKKEKSATGYGKRVENLKSIIKACGMSVPPSIYKKVKQVTDDERETILVKELEGILSREGLSKNPSEKEIKDCRKKKDRARELEGIETSNIISSSRRRSTFSFVAPEKPEIGAKKDKVEHKNSQKEEYNDKDQSDDNKEEDKEEDEVVEEEVEDEEEDEDEDEEEDDEDESEEFDGDDNEESK